jgi:hypothetical protein
VSKEGRVKEDYVGNELTWTAVFLVVTGLLHLMIPTFFDSDTAYHLAVARLTSEHGILHSFPWTPFSWLAEHYADKEFLFHVFLLPFAGLDPPDASKIAGSLLGATLMSVFFLILRAEKIPKAGIWTLMTLVVSGAYVGRFVMVRPHLLSMTLSLLVVWSAARRRWLLLAFGSFLFPLCYTAWHLPLGLVAVLLAAEFLSGRGIDWRVPGLVAAAGLSGVLTHPNFPETVHLFWIQNVEVLFMTAWTGQGGIELGGEFGPFSLPGLVWYLLLPAALLLSSVMPAWRNRRKDSLALAVTFSALIFLVLTLRTQRFIEYLVPFAVMAAALTWRADRFPSLPAALLALGFLYTALFGRYPIDLMRTRTDLLPAKVQAVLGRIVAPEAQVVTCDWELTGELMLALPGRRFIVALDPVFFAVNDPDRYRIWYETVRNPPEGTAGILADTFQARYAICTVRGKWDSFHRVMRADRGARLVATPGFWAVYRLGINGVSP